MSARLDAVMPSPSGRAQQFEDNHQGVSQKPRATTDRTASNHYCQTLGLLSSGAPIPGPPPEERPRDLGATDSGGRFTAVGGTTNLVEGG